MQLLALLLSLFIDDAHADGLLRTAPTSSHLKTRAQAREHIAAAFAAGLVTGTRPTRLLAIAAFESDYQVNAVSTEEAGKVSCGVMTPEPKARCQPSSLVDNYLTGARHLRKWMAAFPHNDRTMMLGYGGGYRAIARCRQEPRHPKCSMPESRNWREEQIKRSWQARPSVLRWGA